ncbi:hypothetical protein JB92DRAFT_2832202 [Gautieria morchelliformis]|nr:hypothetical protein JB92DRAFT_2832202 [Gautieria morchelliformis]
MSFRTSDEALKGQLNEAVGKVTVLNNMNPAPSRIIGAGNVVGIISTTNNTLIPIMVAWDPLLEKIKLFSKIVDGISEVHPYAKMAWSILSSVQKVDLSPAPAA